jgi:hypothetical protein
MAVAGFDPCSMKIKSLDRSSISLYWLRTSMHDWQRNDPGIRWPIE